MTQSELSGLRPDMKTSEKEMKTRTHFATNRRRARRFLIFFCASS
jgi:hypothetical protein